MSVSRGFPETLVQLVADLQTRLGLGLSEDRMILPRASLVRPGDAVPEVYRRSYEAVLGDSTDPPYTVLLPAYRAYQADENGKLVCCLGTNIHVLEDDGGQVRSVCFPVGQISFVETGKVLLNSWVRLHGQNAGGAAAFAEFRFNTATDYVVAPIVDWVRSASPASDEDDLGLGREDFDDLRPINIKLANYARRSVKPGARVVQDIYQPEIHVEVLRLLGFPWFRKRSNPHITILTDKELILIEDGDLNRYGASAIYAGVWHYVLLDKIVSISIAGTTDNLLALSITLPGGDRIERLFSASLRPDLELFVSRFGATYQGQAAPTGARNHKID